MPAATASFGGRGTAWDSPATSAVAITPSDTVDVTGGMARAVWVGGAGNVAILMADDAAPVTFSGVPAGTLLPFATKRVYATGTTATLLIGVR